METIDLRIPDKLVEVFEGEADVRGAHGGRGSAKTRTFAKMTAVRAHMWDQEGRSGIILCARQFMNSLADSSLEEIKIAIREEEWLAPHFDIGETYIRTKSGRISYSFAGLDRNIASIKGKSRLLLAWVEEAEPVTEDAWVKLEPTLREEDSELWVTWNPEREEAATNKRYYNSTDPRTKIVQMNWRDNPWFPDILERKRLKDKAERPHSYEHIWEGAFVQTVEGAYYGPALMKAKEEGRIGFVPEDPHLIVRLCADIGGTGAKADNFVFWAKQHVGLELRWTNHYEAQGQPIAAHLNWMRSQGYTPDRCLVELPHDGDQQDKVFDTSYRKAFEAAGYNVTVVPNQGKGAAMQRVDKARELFGRMRFDEEKTAAGRKALGWYHPKIDPKRQIDLGPDHDWSSHCFTADTKVLTRCGMRRIDSLDKTGEILTPCGWSQYRNPRKTGVNAPLVEVRFAGGYTVRCTPDHLFWTVSGWTSASDLKTGSLIQSSLTRSRSISMAASIACGRVSSIYRRAASAFIGMFGSPHSDLSLRGATYTIGTETSLTTRSTTSNAWTQASTFLRHGMKTKATAASTSPRVQGAQQPNGTGLRLEGFGIAAMPRAPRVGRSGSENRSLAGSAGSYLMRWFGKVETRRSIAPQYARPLRIESVIRLSEREDVWDITVPVGNWFTLENGAVVHNSADAFGTGCVTYEEPRSSAPLDLSSLKRAMV